MLFLLACITSAKSHASDFERSAGPFADCGTTSIGACGELPGNPEAVACIMEAIEACLPSKIELFYADEEIYLFSLEDCGTVTIREVLRRDCEPGEVYYDEACQDFVNKNDFCRDIPLD